MREMQKKEVFNMGEGLGGHLGQQFKDNVNDALDTLRGDNSLHPFFTHLTLFVHPLTGMPNQPVMPSNVNLPPLVSSTGRIGTKDSSSIPSLLFLPSQLISPNCCVSSFLSSFRNAWHGSNVSHGLQRHGSNAPIPQQQQLPEPDSVPERNV